MSRVLIIEDDPDIREMLQYLLAANGYETTCARNGREALVRLAEGLPSVILLDMHMPVMDGWEFRRCQLSDTMNARVPVIAVTAHYDPHAIEETLGIKCLRKPLSVDQIISEINDVCRSRRG